MKNNVLAVLLAAGLIQFGAGAALAKATPQQHEAQLPSFQIAAEDDDVDMEEPAEDASDDQEESAEDEAKEEAEEEADDPDDNEE